MESNPKSLIQNAAAAPAPAQQATQSVAQMVSALIDSNAMRKRFDELLGKRAPQYISAITSLITTDESGKMQQAFADNPMSIIQAALKIATFDLPIEPSLGFAYIVPFKNKGKMTATMVIGYKGMVQLALRTGAYSRVPDAVDVREGELISYDRLTGDCEIKWIEDEAEREATPIIGYAGYFRLKNGAEKTIYMSKAAIEAHERKNRKGDYMGKGWRDDWDAMARKTVVRRLIGKYGLMSIDYQQGSEETVKLAEAVMNEEQPDVVMTITENEQEVTE
ncbi:MAG: recombinase RecT [Ruminococcus sp.]|nr:recombinase RecT [Ruminococcus sp.]